MDAEEATSNKEARKLLDYLKELLTDRAMLSCASAGIERYFHVGKILEREILKVRGDLFLAFGICPISDKDLPKPEGPKVNLQNKIYMPTDLNNSYNFVGRILGPDGSTAKCLQQCLGVKIMIRGRGSMRDRKEEEANIGRPNWEHLNDKLHVLITIEDYENRAKARLAKATDYINMFLKESLKTSDKEDKVKQMQLMELSIKKEARPISWSLNFSGLPNLDYHSKQNEMYEGIGALNLSYGCNTAGSFYSHLQHSQQFGPFTNPQNQHVNHQQLPQTQQTFIGHTTNPLNHLNGYTTTSTTANYPYDSTDLNTMLYLNGSSANYPNSFGLNSQQSHRLTGTNSTSNTIAHNRHPMEIRSTSSIPAPLNYWSNNQNNLGHLSSRSTQLPGLNNTLTNKDNHHLDDTTTTTTTTTTTNNNNNNSNDNLSANQIVTTTNDNNNNNNGSSNDAGNNSDLLKSNYSHIYSQQQEQSEHESQCQESVISSNVNNCATLNKQDTTTTKNSNQIQNNNCDTSYKHPDNCKTIQNTTKKFSADQSNKTNVHISEKNNSKSTVVEPTKIDFESVNNDKLQQNSSRSSSELNNTLCDNSNNTDSMIDNNDASNSTLNISIPVTITTTTITKVDNNNNNNNSSSANNSNGQVKKASFSRTDTNNSLLVGNNNGKAKYSRKHNHIKNKSLSNNSNLPQLGHQLSHSNVSNVGTSSINPIIISSRNTEQTNHSNRSGFNINGDCESKLINKSGSKPIRDTVIQSNDVTTTTSVNNNRNNKIPINPTSNDTEWPVLGTLVNSTSDCDHTSKFLSPNSNISQNNIEKNDPNTQSTRFQNHNNKEVDVLISSNS